MSCSPLPLDRHPEESNEPLDRGGVTVVVAPDTVAVAAIARATPASRAVAIEEYPPAFKGGAHLDEVQVVRGQGPMPFVLKLFSKWPCNRVLRADPLNAPITRAW